jgi:predicted enzyme related to lactoylglutathione lyase
MTGIAPHGMTFELQVGDLAAARAFYTALFGRPPELEPVEGLLEWAVVPDQETWLQVAGVPEPQPLRARLRFAVRDLPAAREVLLASGLEVSETESVPGVVTWCDFDDPSGNRLGLYEDLTTT